MSELKPCPFCGETATLDYSVLPNGKHWFITCDCCGMMYQDVTSQRKYVKDDWNTRPIEDALKARIAELVQTLSHIVYRGGQIIVNLNERVREDEWNRLTRGIVVDEERER